jgi:methylenetetrahydrofolate reductase (NADPH)
MRGDGAMPPPALTAAAAAPADTRQRISALLHGFSIETTRLNPGDDDALKSALPAQSRVYLTAIPGRPYPELIEAAVRLRALGFEPVPHLAARGIANRAMLDEWLSRMAAKADIHNILVIAGDSDRAAGPFNSSIEVIETGLLQRYGITEIGIAGYPQGHPRLTLETLERALSAKIEAAEQTGLRVHIVTQFAFEPAAILSWLARLRDLGIEQPVRIGLAGPTSLSTLLRYAQRCGVRASIHGLTRQAGLIKHLFGTAAPDGIVRPLAEASADGRFGRLAVHFFSFGGTVATARWAAAAAVGRIVLDRADGFGVEPS